MSNGEFRLDPRIVPNERAFAICHSPFAVRRWFANIIYLMPAVAPHSWSDYLTRTLERYADSLVRLVAARLIKPRSQWPADELIGRMVAVMENAAVIDRRVKDLGPTERRLLAFIGHSRQPRWRLGSLLELLAATGRNEGPAPVFALLEAGLLFPDLLAVPALSGKLKNFEQWLGQASGAGFTLFTHPQVMSRALGGDLGLPDCPGAEKASGAVHEADGLEWLVRLTAVWQIVAADPMRETQTGGFFKRDLDRLRTDPLLTAPPADSLTDVPDPGLLTMLLAQAEGFVGETDGEIRAAGLPNSWGDGLPAALQTLWCDLLRLEDWDPQNGWRGRQTTGSPYPSAYLLALLLLARLPEGSWALPAEIGQWILEKHPYWSGDSVRPSQLRDWCRVFLLGVAYQLRLVQALKSEAGEWLVRLTPWGRWALGRAELPGKQPAFPQTLLVQPNLEIVAYRQGLTPGLLGRLARFADWKTLGSACTLQLQSESIYRALEAGESFETILQCLEQHGMRPTPPAVVESLRTWANKRERISVYPAATLMEFSSAEELNEAMGRGLPGIRLSDRLALVNDESAIDFRHFRLLATRDYALPPEPCVAVEEDGVTLRLDVARSDLLLETELPRFAELVNRPSANGERTYCLTPTSLALGRTNGLTLSALETWFQERTGRPLPAAARFLLTAAESPPVQLARHVILHVPTEELADGLYQWPQTRSLLGERLGPTAFTIAEESVEELKKRLEGLGVKM
jgi:hypothetical protein